MKILVPFTFTATAENAMKYAIEVASFIDFDLVCFHATETTNVSDEDKQDKIEAIERTLERLNPENKVSIDIHVAIGDYEEQIEAYADHDDIRAIIVGTREVSGFEKVMMQGRTARFLNGVTMPVFIVPEHYTYKPIKNILWASDFKPIPNDDALDPVVNLAKAYDAEVRIAHVKTTDGHKSPMMENEMHRQDFLFNDGVKHSFKKIRRSSVSKGIKHYLNLKGDNDVLVLMKRKHGFLDTLFKKENSIEFSVNPEIPVFILHEDGRKLRRND
jgi:nucleotide-binding universal stress UspA family protein